MLTIRTSRHRGATDVPAPGAPLWAAGAWKSFATPDRRILLFSIFLQLALAPLFGHPYDSRIFMGTGYLVGTGHTPYVAQDLMPVFHHLYFNIQTTIGYPPPWPLVLGLIYRSVYAVVPNLLAYNMAIKIPAIAANIGLAYLVAAILQNLGARPAACRKAWVALLFNPMLIYFGAAWGQIDAIDALLALWALVLLYAGRRGASAALLALAVCFKPIAVPLLLVALASLLGGAWRQAVRYAAMFLIGVLAFYALPFFLFGWSTTLVHQLWNTQFAQSGRMSFMTVVGLARDPFLMPGRWWYLGLVWIPALGAAVLALRRGDGGFEDIVRKSTGLVLVFFLTRTWLSEDNVILLLPLVLILTALGRLDRRALLAVWTIPLAFTLVTFTPLQLLFPAFPGAMVRSLLAANHLGDIARVARVAVVIAWQVAGWWMVFACFRRRPAPASGREPRPDRPEVEGLAPWS